MFEDLIKDKVIAKPVVKPEFCHTCYENGKTPNLADCNSCEKISAVAVAAMMYDGQKRYKGLYTVNGK